MCVHISQCVELYKFIFLYQCIFESCSIHKIFHRLSCLFSHVLYRPLILMLVLNFFTLKPAWNSFPWLGWSWKIQTGVSIQDRLTSSYYNWKSQMYYANATLQITFTELYFSTDHLILYTFIIFINNYNLYIIFKRELNIVFNCFIYYQHCLTFYWA